MKSRFVLPILLFFTLSNTTFGQDYKDIGLDYIYKQDELHLVPPDAHLPRSLNWSPKGHMLSYLVSFATEAPNLVIYDPVKDATPFAVTPPKLYHALVALASNPQGVTVENTALIQSFPDDATEISKIDWYRWEKESNAIRFHSGKKDFCWDVEKNLLKEYKEEKRELPEGEKNDLEWSPNKRYAAYTRGGNLFIYDTEGKRELQLTDDGTKTIVNGRLPWVYWEEFLNRTSYRAFYWSPNNDSIAYMQFDESDISIYPVTDFSTPVPKTRNMPYPKAGTKNPTVRLGVVSLSNRDTKWINLGEPDEYIARVGWNHDGSILAVQTLNRLQNHLTLHFADPITGRSKAVLEETGDTFVEVHNGPFFLEDRDEFIWISEESGFRHLYRYNNKGKLLNAITQGDWEVVYNIWGAFKTFELDEDHRRLYFKSTKDSFLEEQLYTVSLNGGRMKRITREPGTHSISMSSDFRYVLDTVNNVNTPRTVQVLDRNGKAIRTLGKLTLDDYAPYRMQTRELVEFQDKEGHTFYGSLLKPFDFEPNKKYPVIMHVYGGPAGQVVKNTFTSTRDMLFVNRGFILFRMDNRGTPGRGKKWLEATYGHFGTIELDDLKTGVEFLKTLPYADTSHLGIWGWSHGGYMTCCAMLKIPEVFKAGVAVAPVTDWRLYDTIYTERYMGLPEWNQDGYRDASPTNFAKGLENALLLAHGVSDDNVHIQNSYQLIDALIEAEKHYELYVFPQRDHGIGGDERQIFLFKHILDFFERELKPGQ